MKKPLKIVIIAVAILLGVLSGISLFLRSYLTDERIRTLVTEVAEKSLDREVILGDIKVGLFKGISVKDLEIREKDSDQAFIRTKEFILRYQFFPLLTKRLIIDELRIVEPEVRLNKNPDGSYNFSDIAKTGETPEQKERKAGPPGLPVSLNIKTITIRNAKLSYANPSGKPKKAELVLNAKLGMSGISSNKLASEGKFEITVLLRDGEQPIKNISSDIKYKVDVDMSSRHVTLHSLDADIMKIPLSAQGTFDYHKEHPELNIGIRSSFLDLDRLFVSVPPSQKPRQIAESGSAEKEFGPMNLKLKISASLEVDKARYKGIEITSFKSRCELKDNIFRITDMRGNSLSGDFALQATVDLNQQGTRYNMNADLNSIRLEELVNAFAPKAKGKLFGSLYGKAEFSGTGTLPANRKRNLKGKGSFLIKDGVIKNAEVSTGLLTILGLQDLREIQIQKADGRFTVADRLMHLSSLISSKDLILDEKGTIGFDESLDIGIVAKVSEKLTPRLVSQSAISHFLFKEKGWTSVPLRVSGTISKPSYTIDPKAVGKRAVENIPKKIGEGLFKGLFGK